MGAGGAALAGSLGRGLQQHALAKQGVLPDTSSPEYFTGEALWSLLPPAARSLYGEAGIPPNLRLPIGALDDYMGLLATIHRTSQTTGADSAGGGISLQELADAWRWLSGDRQGPAPNVMLTPGLATQAFNLLGGEQEQPFMVTPPQDVREAFGLSEQVDVGVLGDVSSAAQRLADAGFQVAPKPEPIYYVVEPDDPKIGWQLIDHFDLKPGQRVPLDQAQAMVNFLDTYHAMTGRAADVQMKLLELKRAQYRWANSLAPVDELERLYKSLGLPGEPIIRDFDGDGLVLWEDWLEDNKNVQQLYQEAVEIERVVEVTEGVRLDNAIKRVNFEYTPLMHDLTVRQLAAGVKIDEARAAQIVEELGLNRERTQTEINRILQGMAQDKTAFEADMELRREQIRKARAEGRLTEAEAQLAEQVAGLQALLLEYEVQRAQMEVSPVQAESLWITLGLDGEYSPSGIKLYRGNVEPMLNFMEANAGRVVTARDLFTAAGIDLKRIPEQALEQLIPINEHTLGVVRTVVGVEPEEESIVDSLDLILKLSQLFSPYLSSNLNAQILLATGFARTNPAAAANLLKSPAVNLAEQMDQLMPGSGEVINQVLDSLLRQAAGQLGVATGAAGPTIQSYAQEMVARAGSAQRAYRDAVQYKEILLADESSPLYQNEAAYEQFLAVLRSMAEGR